MVAALSAAATESELPNLPSQPMLTSAHHYWWPMQSRSLFLLPPLSLTNTMYGVALFPIALPVTRKDV